MVAALAAAAATTGVTLAGFAATTGSPGNTFATAESFSSCQGTSITAAYLTGFEFGRRPFHSRNMAIIAPANVDSTLKRSGNWSMKLAPAGASQYAAWTNTLNTTATSQVARFALHLDALPSADVNQLFGMSSAGGLSLRYTAASKKLSVAIKPTAAGTPVVATSDVVMEAGRWYSIEVRYRVAAPTHIADWRIDGSPQPSASVAAASSVTHTTTLGTGSSFTDTYTAHYDDVVISADSTVYPLGDGQIYGLKPNGMGTSVGTAGVIKDNDGTELDSTSWARLDEVPMQSTTDYIEQTVANTSAYAEIALEDTTETCIRAAHGYFTTHSPASTKANHVKIAVVDGTHESILLNGSSLANSTAPRDDSAPVTPASAWSTAALNGLVVRFGYSSSVANGAPNLDGVMVEYEVQR